MSVDFSCVIKCKKCGGDSTVTYAAIDIWSGLLYRTRGCKECGNAWNTYEIDERELNDLLKEVQKRDDSFSK